MVFKPCHEEVTGRVSGSVSRGIFCPDHPEALGRGEGWREEVGSQFLHQCLASQGGCVYVPGKLQVKAPHLRGGSWRTLHPLSEEHPLGTPLILTASECWAGSQAAGSLMTIPGQSPSSLSAH